MTSDLGISFSGAEDVVFIDMASKLGVPQANIPKVTEIDRRRIQ